MPFKRRLDRALRTRSHVLGLAQIGLDDVDVDAPLLELVDRALCFFAGRAAADEHQMPRALIGQPVRPSSGPRRPGRR